MESNEIRRINIQLKKINQLNDSEELQYIGSTIPALVESGLPDILKNSPLYENKGTKSAFEMALLDLIAKENNIGI